MKATRKQKKALLPTKSDVSPGETQRVKARWYTDAERVSYGCDLQYVYELIDPKDNAVFYVGRTKHLIDRYVQHVKGSNDGSAKDERIRIITRGCRLPIMKTVWQACSEKEAIFREAFYIHYHLAAGAALTNATLALNNNGHRGREAYEDEKLEEQENKRSRLEQWIRRTARRVNRLMRRVNKFARGRMQ